MKYLVSLIGLFLSLQSHAFSVKIHIYYANQILKGLSESMGPDLQGPAYLKLLAPDGKPVYQVEINKKDALAIVQNPLYFRGGAIGPDNTAFTGMTDPSHAPQFRPFQQCENLYRTAKTGQEKAYAMGCFLHGITDNVAHHLVNYFTLETFTLKPIFIVEKDYAGKFVIRNNYEHETNFINVVNHILTETTFEKSYKKHLPAEFEPLKMQHKIAKNLYRKVYLNPRNSKFAMGMVTTPIVEKLKAHLAKINQSGKENFSKAYLSREIQAYADFLKNNSLETFEKILFLPIAVKDIHSIMSKFQKRGERKVEECKQTLFKGPKCLAILYLYERNFENNFESKFDTYIWSRQKILDQIIDGELDSLKNLSNLFGQSENFTDINPISLKRAMKPLKQKIDQFLAPPVELLPRHLQLALEKLGILNEIITTYEEMVKKVIYDAIYGAFEKYILELSTAAQALKEQAKALLSEQMIAMVRAIRDGIKQGIDQRTRELQLSLIGRESDDAEFDLLGDLPNSVAHMNAYNSIVGVLANHGVVINPKKNLRLHYRSGDEKRTPDFKDGPVSFDASFQLEYNQLKLCPDYSEIFYPCGTATHEMLQPGGYKNCSKLAGNKFIANPIIECFLGENTHYAILPNETACTPKSFEEVIEHFEETSSGYEFHHGSHSMSFPPEYLPEFERPICRPEFRLIISEVLE